MNKGLLSIVIIALAGSIIAGAFYYAKRAGKAECVAEYNQKEKANAEAETKRWIDRPHDGDELAKRLYARAKYKHETRVQRTARYLRSEVAGSPDLPATKVRDE